MGKLKSKNVGEILQFNASSKNKKLKVALIKKHLKLFEF